MYELLDLLQRLPKPIKTLGLVFLLMPICFVVARALGFGQYWWAVGLGLIVIALAIAAFDAFVKKGDKARGGAFEKDLARDAQGGAGASKQEVREAVRELSQKWTESLAQLKGTGLQIYSLPWYLLIGEPQSGKSTTLKNSGLEFPVGGDGLSGSGGTRNCDWWFANEAVILDTAGRFTFQEEAAPDATEWSTFLKMLKKYRRDCPINGVLVVIPATSLLEDTPEEQDKKAANIRSKLMNLQRVLEIRFPVFIMVTKADRILGFSEFFSKLDPVDQRQLVGWSNPQGPDKQYALGSFDEAYEEILTRIHKLRMKFTANEEIVQNVDRIFVFPEELRALGGSLKRYFQGIFQETRYDDPFVFRGFYLSSGVQQGKPIARATREMLGSSAEGIVENLEQIFKRSRAFFIKDFYEKKVFPEQGLIARTKAAIQKEKTTVWVIRGLSAFIVLLVLVGMIPAYIGLKGIVEPIKRNVAAAQECVEKEPCPIPKAYGISRDLFKSQAEIRKHPVIFAMFFRGAASGELSDLLARINQKLFISRVANPLMKEGEARMAQLDWAGPYDYRTFFGALDNHLKWWTVKKAVPGADQKPIVASTELKIIPLVQFCQNTKGMPATARSKEIDDWVASIATDGTPDQILATFVKEPPKDPELIQVPDPGAAIRKFEEFWTVANLARWDFRLNQMLALYVQKYTELLKIEDPSSKGYLDRAAATGKEFKKVYDDATKHLATTKPGSKEFPGFGPDDWRRNFDADYDKLMRYTVVVPGVINENARNRIKGQMESDWKNLEAQILAYAYLVVADPQNPTKKSWSPAAAAISPMLVDVTSYADLAAFEAAENPKAVVEEASRKSTPADQKATLEAFSKKQVDAKAKATANVTAIAGIPPDQKGPWQDAALSAFVPRTADLALVFRVLPYTQQFLDKSIGPTCLENVCFTRNHAQQMIPLGVSYISFAEASSIATRPDVDALAQAHAETMLDYLRRYVDRFAGRRTGGGGGGFVVPGAALQARTWREFQAAITRWTPESQGGGDAPVTDMSGALSFDDVQAFSAANRRLNGILAYYKGKAAPVRAAGGPQKAPPELVTAANLFKNNVVPLPEQELKAWKQLSLAQEGVSLRGYHAFSRNPAVRRSTYGKQLIAVESRGANLIRDAIQPSFQQAADPIVKKIREQCMGQFPFVRESQLRQERVAYASGSSLKPGGSGNSATYRLDLASINQGHFSGVLTDVGALADEYALNPILWGWEPQFDFVGDASRGLLAVGRGWQIFLFGGSRGTSVIKEHKVEIRPLQFTPSQGKRFMGDRVNSLFLFDRSVVVRPSTDFKTGKQPNPYVWRLGPSDAPMSITGRDEESKAGWTGSLEAYGGPLRFFYFVRIASEERERREDTDDPEKEREKEKIWTIRVVIPNALQRTEPLEGLFELAFDEPMPPILPN
ncbi:MAG: type VI secretion protein IcmF/TssM N-terminal domain-containing protein [Thermoanaerobaculia bacterium]